MTLWKLWQDASPIASNNARLLPGEIGFISYHLRKITLGSQRFATPVYLDPFGSAVGRRLCILPGISRHVMSFHTLLSLEGASVVLWVSRQHCCNSLATTWVLVGLQQAVTKYRELVLDLL